MSERRSQKNFIDTPFFLYENTKRTNNPHYSSYDFYAAYVEFDFCLHFLIRLLFGFGYTYYFVTPLFSLF